MGFAAGSDSKKLTCNTGAPRFHPWLKKSPGEGSSNPLQYLAWRISCAEDPGGLQSMGLQKSQTRLSD